VPKYSIRNSVAKDHMAQPFTVFTLVGSDSLGKGSGRAAAVLFNKIATNSLMKGRQSELERSTAKESIKQASRSGAFLRRLGRFLRIKNRFQSKETNL